MKTEIKKYKVVVGQDKGREFYGYKIELTGLINDVLNIKIRYHENSCMLVGKN
jgi:hypothetical protein